MKDKHKRILKIVSNVLIIIVAVLAFLFQGTRLIGLKPYVVLSGSMQSVYPTGSILYTKSVEPETLKVGDVITYKMAGGTMCTHRIVEIVSDKNDQDIIRFRTKGDENDSADGVLVGYGAVVGKAMFCIPLIGYIATYVAMPPGKYVAITVAILLVLIEVMINLVLDDKDEKKHRTEQN